LYSTASNSHAARKASADDRCDAMRDGARDAMRVRSPTSLHRVAFDVATLRQPFQATKPDDDDDDSNAGNESSRPQESGSLSRPESRPEISTPRKPETLVA
jgi:hypothetical protein